jgi:hypothetical protein
VQSGILLDISNLGLLSFEAEKTKRNPPLNPAFRQADDVKACPLGVRCVQGGFFAFIGLLTTCFLKINGRREPWV